MARLTRPAVYCHPMVPPTGDEGELGALLVLLQGAADPFRTVQATYRTWRHEERLLEAFRADTEEQKRRGASISSVSAFRRTGDPGPSETEETVRIWRDGQRIREEHHGGGWRDGSYSVADGPLWWVWSEHTGAMSNQDDPRVGGGVGQELQVMLNPTPLLSLLRFRIAGNSQVAGRATVTAQATPQPQDPRHGRFLLELHQLGKGADHYQLEVDQERGVLLAATAIRDDQPFYKITTLAIGFDEPIPAETFRFVPPEGEKIQPTRARERMRPITLTEAQQRAPFTVLMPDRVPASWRVHCMFIEASPRPRLAAHVLLNYHSDDGHQSISISQMAAADASRHYGNMIDDENWQQVTRDGVSVRVRPADWSQAQVQIERDGTFVFLTSDNLTVDQLATLAAGLRPAPSTDGI
jgi:hypothetical protein